MKRALIISLTGIVLIMLVRKKSRWRFIHNSLVHPLIGVFDETPIIMELHDKTGNKWGTSG